MSKVGYSEMSLTTIPRKTVPFSTPTRKGMSSQRTRQMGKMILHERNPLVVNLGRKQNAGLLRCQQGGYLLRVIIN